MTRSSGYAIFTQPVRRRPARLLQPALGDRRSLAWLLEDGTRADSEAEIEQRANAVGVVQLGQDPWSAHMGRRTFFKIMKSAPLASGHR